MEVDNLPGIILASLGIIVGVWWLKGKVVTTGLQRKIDTKKKVRANNENKLRDELDKILSDDPGAEKKWDDVLKMDFESLATALKAGRVSAVTALRAYQNKAIGVNKKLNCVVSYFEDAEKLAKDRDNVPESNRGPLHGIPMSIKECYAVKGEDYTAGLSRHLLDPADEDCLAVRQLLALGAVPFCQTNVPQTMYSLQTSNPAYGATGNPHDESRECGGSSGGEGSLIGGGGSVLGIGSDLGGSLRSPAAMCGCFSLRPSYGRHVSQLQTRSPVPYEAVDPKVVGGFLASQLSGLVTAVKAYWGILHNRDPTIVPLPWNEERFSSKKTLRVGYYTQDGLIEPHPGYERAVNMAVDLLKKKGHTVVKIEPPSMTEVFRLYIGLAFADWGSAISDTLGDSIYDGSTAGMRLIVTIYKLPTIVQRCLFAFASLFTKMPMPIPCGTGQESMMAHMDRDGMVQEFHDRMAENAVDAIITPGASLPAPVKGTHGWVLLMSIAPYIPWNIMNMPAGIMPITTVTEEDDKKLDGYPTNEMEYRIAKKGTKGAIGVPLAVQVVGRRFDEEGVLRVMKELDEAKREE